VRLSFHAEHISWCRAACSLPVRARREFEQLGGDLPETLRPTLVSPQGAPGCGRDRVSVGGHGADTAGIDSEAGGGNCDENEHADDSRHHAARGLWTSAVDPPHTADPGASSIPTIFAFQSDFNGLGDAINDLVNIIVDFIVEDPEWSRSAACEPSRAS